VASPNPPVSVAQFKAQFTRDWPYGAGTDAVRDADIQNALNLAASYFNAVLFDTTPLGAAGSGNTTTEQTLAYLYASAHFLVLNIQAAGGLRAPSSFGGTRSGSKGPVSSKGVGGISESYVWPQSVTDNPMLFQFTQTAYGRQYLQMLMPKLVGNVVSIFQCWSPESGY